MSLKRQREGPAGIEHAHKRLRISGDDRLSPLSDELVLRILSFLDVSDVFTCHRLSRRLKALASDSQIWQLLYYRSFVKPKSSRMLKLSRWLQDHRSLTDGRPVDWKRRYKLSHNWNNGRCCVRDTQVPKPSPLPPLLVQMHMGLIVTLEKQEGLKIWSSEEKQTLLASHSLIESASPTSQHSELPSPTALAVNSSKRDPESLNIAVGFENSTIKLYEYSLDRRKLGLLSKHSLSSHGAIKMIAISDEYLAIYVSSGRIELLALGCPSPQSKQRQCNISLRCLAQMSSYTPSNHMRMTIKVTKAGICISLVFSLPWSWTGWSIGIQEIMMDHDGKQVSTRITSSYPTPNKDLTSICYTHPYLLTAHADNTMMLFLVTSNEGELRIGEGYRLWGHACSVAGASIDSRGKAVSVTRKGGELKVWDLEGGGDSPATRKHRFTGNPSVRIRSGSVVDGIPKGLSLINQAIRNSPHIPCSEDWVSFDEEKVIVLRERVRGSQALLVYDFT